MAPWLLVAYSYERGGAGALAERLWAGRGGVGARARGAAASSCQGRSAAHPSPPPEEGTLMPDPIQSLLDEHAELQRQLADPAVHAEQGKARRLGRRYAALAPVVEKARVPGVGS